MNRKYPLALLALAAVSAIPTTAHANRNDADATCAGMVFSMPATEDGTTIVVTRNGVEEYRIRNDVFGKSYALNIPSPDQTVVQVWRVTVSGFNGTTNWTETVAPCIAPTTSTSTTVAVTTPPVPTTVPTTQPPVVASTVVTTPRTPTTTVPAPATTVPFALPETGAGEFWGLFTLLAAAIGALGFVLVRLNGGRR